MRELHRNIKVRVKLKTQPPLRHQVYIESVPMKILDLVDGYYTLHLQRRSTHQQLEIRMLIDKNIVMNKESIKRDITTINFNKETFDIVINRDYSIPNIKKEENMYVIRYKSNQFQLKVEVINRLTPNYYEKLVQTYIKKKSKNKKGTIRKRPKNIHKKQRRQITKEELLRRDFYEADQYRYTYSPNSDGERSSREVFGGNVGNFSRGRRKRK
ncbi:hypothetical protein [Virgibacillus kimchii]